MDIRQLLDDFHQEVENVTASDELEIIARRYITGVEQFNVTIISAIRWVVKTRATSARVKQQARKEAETCENQYIFLCAQWSPQRVDHYKWAKGPRKFLRQLVKVATAYPRWQDFISNINLALLDRHILSVQQNWLPKIGDKHGRAIIRDKSSPVVFRDMEMLLDRQTTQSQASDVDRWVNRYEEVAPIGTKYRHYAITLDQYGMLIPGQPPPPSSLKRAPSDVSTRVLLKTRKIDRQSTAQTGRDLAVQRILGDEISAHGRRAMEEENQRSSNDIDRTSKNDDRATTEQGYNDDDDETFVQIQRSSASGAQFAVKTKSSDTIPPSCCADSNYHSHHDEPLLEKSYRQALTRHGFPKSGSVCDVNLAWISRMRMADARSGSDHSCTADRADLITMDAEHLKQFATTHVSAFQLPILIRKGESNLRGLTLPRYLQRLADRLGHKDLSIVRPNSAGHMQQREALSSNDVPGLAERPIFGMNALDLADFTAIPGPDFLHDERFQLLDILVCRLNGMHKTSDIKGCLRFNILGCEGAFSGPHCDILSGTWVQNIDGVKLWMWVHPRDMSSEDWKAFAQHKHEWIPPPGKVRATLIRRGETFIMPAGLCIPHAVQTIETCAMVGGMFWDEACILESLDCLARLMKNQDTTNEPVPLDIGSMVDELLSFIGQKSPDLDMSDLQTAVERVKALCCACKKCNTNCPCARVSRRCTYLCTNHRTQKKTHCCVDQWWVNKVDDN